MVDLDRGKQLMVADEEESNSQPDYDHKYPEPLAEYKDVVEDRNLFMDTLGKLHAAMSTKFMIPVIGGKELDLHRLFVEVTARGGIEKVVADRRWREVTAVFNFPSTATNASFILRKYYNSLLHHYEQLYFFGSQGWNSPVEASPKTPADPIKAVRLVENVLQKSTNLPSIRKRKSNGELIPADRPPVPSPNGGQTPCSSVVVGPSAQANRTVAGIIDGKFEHGYFVTVTIGNQNLKGVIFHTPEQATNQTADNTNVNVGRRRRRKKKLSTRDPTHPKPNRSGYNFFFAEQHARLKPLHPGKDRVISKIIGELWSKLTETEKAVYQERGMKDKERYISEMEVYRGRLNTGQVISNAVPIQQIPAESVAATNNIDEGELNEEDNNGSFTDDDSSESEGNKSEESEPEDYPDVVDVAAVEPASFAADASAKGGDFESKEVSEPSSDQL